jgi:hypothetical protein
MSNLSTCDARPSSTGKLSAGDGGSFYFNGLTRLLIEECDYSSHIIYEH